MSDQVDLSPSQRHTAAERALADLGNDRDDHALVRVRCGRSHHVAAVFDTAIGAVYESLLGPHAHGDRDFIDTAHHGRLHGTPYVDLVDAGPFVDDVVPARCECGTHELSRAELRRAIDAHQRTIFLS